jgi:DNA processing protein
VIGTREPSVEGKLRAAKLARLLVDDGFTVSALTKATIIIEAGERSGALVQGRHALKQSRKLFILENCFQNPSLRWPETFATQGAIGVADYEDVRRHFADAR